MTMGHPDSFGILECTSITRQTGADATKRTSGISHYQRQTSTSHPAAIVSIDIQRQADHWSGRAVFRASSTRKHLRLDHNLNQASAIRRRAH
jgi:hypothetical protein